MTQKQTSLYDVVKERLRKGQRVTYLHRITYVGEHSFRDDPTVKQLYEEIIRDMNSEDPDEILTGFLLCYDEFFVHILEGSEEMILRHLHRIYALVDGGEARLGTMKLLIACHNVRQRFYKQWAARTTRPPTLLQDIDPACEAETTWRHVRTCITKLHQLSKFLSQRTGVALKTVIDRLSETVPTCLPESVLLNFVLQCKSLPNLRKYMNAHCTISTSESYQETVWPIPGELVPLNLLDTEDHKFLCDMDVMTRPLPPTKEDSQS
ncbi:testis-expressed protein 47 [Cryptotermes secundus]|uniref:testis-expressed protein 47 n=1 Tax=Cryptotermes secundus TaxID=105785 RepID=UPI000CD7BFD4|nr:testis-expressed protein 47 [Cryptotermes secundus]